MAKNQSAVLDRKKFYSDPVLVTTIVVLIAFLTLFILKIRALSEYAEVDKCVQESH